ncbi:MAG: VOC family protein [Chitinophagaceae bacterium]|uniref:bleomycin resistance protein n=1 Tax=unclassified Paraflavitalea TaxID=2798305 RepID=UPI003D32CE10|nr:VOC family protein [Chitinophagaceae bacterium]
MSLLAAVPILAYLNKEETVAFYTNLKFEVNAVWDGYIMCSRDEIEIHLWQCNDPEIPKNTGCYVRVNKIEGLNDECTLLGCVHPNGALEDKPWGMRQFSILDNSGNIIHFGQRL